MIDVPALISVLVPSLTLDISGMEPLKLCGRNKIAGRSGITGFSRIAACDVELLSSSVLLECGPGPVGVGVFAMTIVVLGRATGFTGSGNVGR